MRPFPPIACLLLALAACGPGTDGPKVVRSPRKLLPLQPVSGPLALGSLATCGDPLERTVRVANRSAAAVEVLDVVPSCHCLTAALSGAATIAPGEERDLQVSLAPSGLGERWISVELGGAGGSLGVVEVSYVARPAPLCVPDRADHAASDGDRLVEVQVAMTDGSPVGVVAVDPPVGTAAAGPDGRATVSISTFEARAFASSPAGLASPAVVRDADGTPRELRITVRTDAKECADPAFTLRLGR